MLKAGNNAKLKLKDGILSDSYPTDGSANRINPSKEDQTIDVKGVVFEG